MPTRHRDLLGATANGQLTVTVHWDLDCLIVFPRPDWEKFSTKVRALPSEAEWVLRQTIGWATEVELDGTGRFLVAPELRTFAKIDKDVHLIGMGNRFELWDRETYAANLRAARAAPKPESMKNFTI